MVFNWFKGAAQRKFADMQRKEMEQFIAGLDGADDSEIALVVALATNFRHSLKDVCDLSDPINNVSPEVPLQLVRHYQDLQKRGMQKVAPGVAVWLHTARASQTPENRKLARKMWSVLSRGFTCVPEAASEFKSLTAERLDIVGYDEFPLGFEPQSDEQFKKDMVTATAEGAVSFENIEQSTLENDFR